MNPTKVFVFGSNLAGIHGKGAALYAAKFRCAQSGVGEGLTGHAYAIPTKDRNIRSLPLEAVSEAIARFIEFARLHPEFTFEVTRVGCGLAGFADEQIAPLFANAPANCILPMNPQSGLSWRQSNSDPETIYPGLLYAGVGSRATPEVHTGFMFKLAERLADRGWKLRSGAAEGADAAFEAGCDAMSGDKEIWLPWKGFNKSPDMGYYPTPDHITKASFLHPAWERLGNGPRLLHARNVGQILGMNLNQPVSMVVCWTECGSERQETNSRRTGGTATAIALASQQSIPVFNLQNPGAKQALYEHVARQHELQAARTSAPSKEPDQERAPAQPAQPQEPERPRQ